MRGYFPEADGTDAANAEWDMLTKNIENGYCDTKGWLRRHYAAVCASFEGKISNAGGNIKKESKVFGNYTMAEAYSHAYALSARADTAEPMLDFVEQWYRGIRAQMSAQRMTHSDENALNRVLVLHGNPGDGKTTFCKKAVYAHCLEGWLADVPHVVRVSLNRNENRGILKDKSLNLANALGVFMRPTNQFLFCAPHKLGEGSVVILDGYDELVGDLAGDVNVSTFAEFCDRVREQADICKWFVIITSRTMCIRRELDEKKDDFETGTVASFAPMTVTRQDLMIDRMIELDEARRQNSGPGRTPGGSNDVTDLRTYQEGELEKLRNEKRIRKFLEIPILFRMIVTTRFKAGEGTATEAGLYGRLFHNLMQYRDRTRVNEATLIADYENIAARIFNYNNDICPFGSGDDENKELIYLFLTKNEEEKGDEPEEGTDGQKKHEEEKGDEPEEGTDGQKKRRAKKRGGRRKEGRLGFLHGSFRQYFLARYLVSGIRKSCAEGGKAEFLDFFRNLRARPIDEHLVWTFVYELVRIGGTEQDPFRDTMPNEDAEPDGPLTMKEVKAVRKFLDDEMAFADWMAGDAAYEQGPDAQKQRWLMAENAVFNLVSALAAAERACREEGEEADGYRNYANLARLLRRGYWGNDVGIYLEGAELSGCNLYRANLANAYLAGACLKGTSLRSANLKGAELEGADLRDTTFEGADLSGTVIRNAFFGGANFAGANFTDAILEDASPDGSDAGDDGNGEKEAEAGRENTVFQGANLTGAKMKGIHLENADLVGADLANADLTDAILQGAILTGADLANADLTDAILQGAILTGADLANADLSGTILEGADLTGANLKGADFSGAILTGAHLDGADLREAWLIGADLTGAHLMDAYLDRAVLKNAILTDAHLERTHLEGAELSGADFRNAHLEGANLKAAYLDALIPGQTAVTNGDLSGCSDLTGAYLSGADLHGTYISDSQFQYARKRGATGRPFTAPGEKLRSYPGRIRDVLKVAGKGSRQAAELVSGMGQIAFGRYKQGRNGEMLPLRWRVLKTDVEKNRVLLITEKLIDCRAYHNQFDDIFWKECDLRKWLNEEFPREAFTRDEWERIAVTVNENPDNAKYKTPGGSSTDDRIFLLSMDEAGACFRDDRDRRADVTPYAKGQYRRSDFCSMFGDEGMGWWWLRSPGIYGHIAANVNNGGFVNEDGYGVGNSGVSVRPALWLNL